MPLLRLRRVRFHTSLLCYRIYVVTLLRFRHTNSQTRGLSRRAIILFAVVKVCHGSPRAHNHCHVNIALLLLRGESQMGFTPLQFGIPRRQENETNQEFTPFGDRFVFGPGPFFCLKESSF
ncbi:hypothetical protein E2542_SST00622 [Spatholobus suberectus]|nr:hypothetical protein E2542_SST00622 [Spatholobus suberectus]